MNIKFDFNKLSKLEPDFTNTADIIDDTTKKSAREELNQNLKRSEEEKIIKEYIEDKDKSEKSLTGRTPEMIEVETSIKKEEIFPPDKKILYVGDPWQRMGREIDKSNLTIIDYEYGEVVSFIQDDESFRNYIEKEVKNLLDNIETAKENVKKEDDFKWLDDFYKIIKRAEELSISAEMISLDPKNNKTIEQYKKTADVWLEAKESIEAKYKKDKLLNQGEENYGEAGDNGDYDSFVQMRINAWYKCVEGERGFRDIPDWHNTILPKLNKIIDKEQYRKGEDLTEEEIENIVTKNKKGLIEDIRLKKKTDQSNIVEAMFPELPFKNNSFDRFVASWSISAHIFQEMNPKEFNHCWKEIVRVLNKDGEAFIFPLDYYFDNHTDMLESLKKVEGELNLEWKIFENDGEECSIDNNDFNYGYTLWIKKN